MSAIKLINNDGKKSETGSLRRSGKNAHSSRFPRVLTGDTVEAVAATLVSNSNHQQDDATCATARPEWSDLNRLNKASVITDSMQNAHPFTLNFKDDLIDAAKGHSKDLTTYISNRISDCLRSTSIRWGEDFDRWFTIEIAKAGYVHIHGVIQIANDNALPDVIEALRKASGTAPKDYKGRAVLVAEFEPTKQYGGCSGREGWVQYCFKRLKQTRKLLEARGFRAGAIASFNQRLLRSGRSAWEARTGMKATRIGRASSDERHRCAVWGTWFKRSMPIAFSDSLVVDGRPGAPSLPAAAKLTPMTLKTALRCHHDIWSERAVTSLGLSGDLPL